MNGETITLLFCAGLSAGFIDSIAGGGGLISVPALLWAGLPPQVALGTNKMQSTWGTMLAVNHYRRAGLVNWPEVRLAVAVTFVFALLGTWTVTQVSNEVLKEIVPWLLLGIAAYALMSPRFGHQAARPRLSPRVFALLGGSALGFYDGFFGPGTGSFWTVACLSLMIAGQLIGARLGSGLVVRHGAPFIRVVFLIVVFAMVAKLLWDQWVAN